MHLQTLSLAQRGRPLSRDVDRFAEVDHFSGPRVNSAATLKRLQHA
jgi:hypothetical protein